MLIRGPVGRVGIAGDGSRTSMARAAGGSPVGADSDGQQAACRSYGPSPGRARAVVKLAVNLRRGRRAATSVRPADGGGPSRADAGGARSAVKCEPCADGPGKARASGRARVGRVPYEVAGVLLTGQVGATATRTRTGLELPRTRRAGPGWNRDSDPAEPTTRQVHDVSHVLILPPSDSAARLGPRVQPAIPASGVNTSAPASSAPLKASDRSLLALLICSLFLSPVSPILANTPAPPFVLLSALTSPLSSS